MISSPTPEAPAAGPPRPVQLSVCIPAYNRAAELPALLDSIVTQEYPHYEIVICEDNSPQRAAIRDVVARYDRDHPGRIRYVENAETLGYDGNFREMIRRARGDYCFIMGNDDLVAPGALGIVGAALAAHPDVGVLLRTYGRFFPDRPDDVYTVIRYYQEALLFPPGPDTVVAFYRRLVTMSGLVFHRGAALRHETDRFDGTLFYQQHLGARILLERPGLFLPDVLALYREGNSHDFGASRHEQGRFTAGPLLAAASVRFLGAHLDIIRHVDEECGTALYPRVHRDEGRNMYPTFATSAGEGARAYFGLYRQLWRMGFWRYPMFHAYAAGVALLGAGRSNAILHALRRRLGYSPSLTEKPRHAIPLAAAAAGS